MKDVNKQMVEDLKEILFAVNHLRLENTDIVKNSVRKHKVVSDLEGTNLTISKMLIEEIMAITSNIPNPNLTPVQSAIRRANKVSK
jgi:hypothetical protein